MKFCFLIAILEDSWVVKSGVTSALNKVKNPFDAPNPPPPPNTPPPRPLPKPSEILLNPKTRSPKPSTQNLNPMAGGPWPAAHVLGKPQAFDVAVGRNALSLGGGLHLLEALCGEGVFFRV